MLFEQLHHLIKRIFRPPLLQRLMHILLSVGVSYLLLCLIFPDLFIFTRLSFIRFSDTEINFYGTFSLVSNLYHGGIQLWDNYDQMPFAYFYTAVSMLSFSTLWTAAVYSMLAPFVTYPGIFFQVLYSRFYYVPAMVMLCVGCYLLFRRFTKKPALLLLLTIYTESLLVPQMYLGLNTESLFSFFPLLIHFILAFFERGRFRDAVLAYCIFVICVGMFPLIAIGYFYQGVHFTLLPIIVWWLVTRRKDIFRRSTPSHVWQVLKKGAKIRRRQMIVLGAAVLTILLLVPHIVLLKTTYHMYDVAHETSRFAHYNPLHITDYFSRETGIARQSEFLMRLLKFDDNLWAYSWLFLGTVAVFLALCGLILSTDSRKYIFASAVFCYWLLNSLRVMTGWQSIIHWINAITNPFNVAVRSMHMTGSLMMPLVLAPLIGMGLMAVLYPRKEPLWKILVKETAIILCLGVVVQAGLHDMLAENSWYPKFGLIICMGILLVRMIRFPGFRVIAGVALVVLVSVDGYGMNHYMKQVAVQMDIKEHLLPVSSEPLTLDYQNPLILPFRQYTNAAFTPNFQAYLNENPHNSREQFLRYTNYMIYFPSPDQYHARHIRYSRLAWDSALQQYLSTTNELIAQFPLAIPEQEGKLAELLAKKLDNQVVLIDHDPHLPDIYSQTLDETVARQHFQPAPVMHTATLSLAGHLEKEKEGVSLYRLPMPADMPKTLATGVFTADSQLITAKVGNQELSPVQGNVRSRYTFDVQNMATGSVMVGLPSWDHEVSVTLTYAVSSAEGVGEIHTYQPDTMDFDYHMNTNGWMVLHLPYDPKWELQVDGVSQELYRANYSFIGVPLPQGTHRIQLSYWPNWWLRGSLAVTMLLIMFTPFAIIWYALRYRYEE